MIIWGLQAASDYTDFIFVDEDSENWFEKIVEDYFEESKPVEDKWEVCSMLRGEFKKHPDFFEIANSGVIAMSKRAKDVLESFVVKTEFLPINTDAGVYYAINVLNVLDCLNKEESKFVSTKQGQIVEFTYIDFYPEMLEGNNLFKIPEMPYRTFVSSVFLEEYEMNDFEGLEIDKSLNLIYSIE